ncbi:hypothetical protein Hanom_Chr03g00179261 [Helianthus anomalus]
MGVQAGVGTVGTCLSITRRSSRNKKNNALPLACTNLVLHTSQKSGKVQINKHKMAITLSQATSFFFFFAFFSSEWSEL